MSVVFITARIGSKRLKKKNIKIFFGKPVIYYSIKSCKKIKSNTRVIVSTDSQLVAKISKKYGAEVPFLRPKKFADDKTSTIQLMRYLVKKFNLPLNEVVICVYPVTPLLTSEILQKALKIFKISRCSFLMPVIKVKKKSKVVFNITNNKIINKDIKKKKDYYQDAGQFYIGKAKSFLNQKSLIFSGSTKALVLPENSVVDVNNLKDWQELKKIYLTI